MLNLAYSIFIPRLNILEGIVDEGPLERVMFGNIFQMLKLPR